ncbi:hypothetical protein KBC85_01160 [Candidatus Saccharibacteria bacterium]|nr:hypothetical protein [Candidatus Saccharibacteria bacterium]MDQ5885576.1 hypothetical protein [Patescibacteria group bacterium]MDQ5953461.1 hypothetical protein [Patescibacteria group bacterium]MDQ5958199.1 hypothetical protein [Patescibacteria group bacterium]
MTEGFKRLDVEGPRDGYPLPSPDDLHTLNELSYAHIGAETDASVESAESELNDRDKAEILAGICSEWNVKPEKISLLLNASFLRTINAALEFQDKGSDAEALKAAAEKHITTVGAINDLLNQYTFSELTAASKIIKLQFEADVNYKEGALKVDRAEREEIAESARVTAQRSKERFDELYGEAGKRIIQGENLAELADRAS